MTTGKPLGKRGSHSESFLEREPNVKEEPGVPEGWVAGPLRSPRSSRQPSGPAMSCRIPAWELPPEAAAAGPPGCEAHPHLGTAPHPGLLLSPSQPLHCLRAEALGTNVLTSEHGSFSSPPALNCRQRTVSPSRGGDTEDPSSPAHPSPAQPSQGPTPRSDLSSQPGTHCNDRTGPDGRSVGL